MASAICSCFSAPSTLMLRTKRDKTAEVITRGAELLLARSSSGEEFPWRAVSRESTEVKPGSA